MSKIPLRRTRRGWTQKSTEIANIESRVRLDVEIINLTMYYLNQKWTSGTEDSNT